MKCLLFLCACYALLLVGCSEDGPVQPNSATSNDSIVRQMAFGSEHQWSGVYYLAANSADNVVFGGIEDDEPRVSEIGQGTTITWSQSTGSMLGLRMLPVTIGSATEVAVVTGRGRNGSDALLAGYDSSGNVVVEKSFAYPGYDVWFSDVTLVSTTTAESRLVCAGGAYADGVRYPYLVGVTLSNLGEVLTQEQRVLSSEPGRSIWWLISNEQPFARKYFATVAHVDANDDLTGARVWAFDDTLGVVWRQNVAPAGSGWTDAEEIRYLNGAVYVVGQHSVQKNDWWYRSGLVASISESGTLNWTKSVAVSDKSDAYYGCVIVDNSLYAVGEYSRVVQRSTTHSFGYGLLTKVALPTGDIVFHRTFGDPAYASRLWTVDVRDGRALCGGFTRQFLNNYWYQGWFLEVDLTQPAKLQIPSVSLRDDQIEHGFPTHQGAREVGR